MSALHVVGHLNRVSGGISRMETALPKGALLFRENVIVTDVPDT